MQTNIQPGELVFPAKTNLEAKEGRLVKVSSTLSGQRACVELPSAVTDVTPFVLTDCNKGSGANVSCLPLSPSYNVRVALKGTCSSGAKLVLAAPGDNNVDAGKVEALPATAGSYRVVGIAEEQGVDGMNVLLRPFNELVTVAEQASAGGNG